jgi:molybdate transport system regulatory protein
MNYRVSGRVWIETEQGTYAGTGRIRLLENIRQYGSITEAARAMKMSYRQAWELVDSMNKLSGRPVVNKISGGSGGGGSVVTAEGEKLIAEFHKVQAEFAQFSHAETQKLEL